MYKDFGMRISFSETSFITAENWTQLKCATTGQNLNQFCGKQTTLKKNVKEMHLRTMAGCSQYAK